MSFRVHGRKDRFATPLSVFHTLRILFREIAIRVCVGRWWMHSGCWLRHSCTSHPKWIAECLQVREHDVKTTNFNVFRNISETQNNVNINTWTIYSYRCGFQFKQNHRVRELELLPLCQPDKYQIFRARHTNLNFRFYTNQNERHKISFIPECKYFRFQFYRREKSGTVLNKGRNF